MHRKKHKETQEPFLEQEMNEDCLSKFIYYFAVNIMLFLKNTEMKTREIIVL